MANDIKNEFEEYVQKLTTAICKEIFLEKLEEILKEYESGFQMMENSTGKVEFASNALLNEVKRAEKSMNYFEENIGKTTQLLTADIAKMESLMRNLFERMKSDNEESKRGFIEALAKSINDYKYEIEKTIHSGCDLISDKMQGIITPEQLTYFVEQIEENTRESKELATFINDTYKDEIVQNISTIINNNRIAVEQMEKELSLHINKIMASLEGAIDSTDIIFSKRAEDFSNVVKNQTAVLVKYLTKLVYGERDEREKFLTRQEELIKAIGPSDEKMNQLEAKVQRLEGLIRELETQNQTNNKELKNTLMNYMSEQKALDVKRHSDMMLIEKRAESLAWKIYMAYSNTMIMGLFVLLIIFQKPWEVFGYKVSAIIVGVFSLSLILVSFLRKKIAKAIVRRQEKKSIEVVNN